MNLLQNLPGNAEAMQVTLQGAGKAQYFASGARGWKLPHDLPKEKVAEWRREYDLCDCSTCYDMACRYRNDYARFPADTEIGKNQCLRFMQAKTPFAFRNGEGTVIEIPPEVVRAIREGGKGAG